MQSPRTYRWIFAVLLRNNAHMRSHTLECPEQAITGAQQTYTHTQLDTDEQIASDCPKPKEAGRGEAAPKKRTAPRDNGHGDDRSGRGARVADGHVQTMCARQMSTDKCACAQWHAIRPLTAASECDGVRDVRERECMSTQCASEVLGSEREGHSPEWALRARAVWRCKTTVAVALVQLYMHTHMCVSGSGAGHARMSWRASSGVI